MRIEPLSIRYANGDIDTKYIIKSFILSTKDEKSKIIAEEAQNNVPDLSVFKKDFKLAIIDVLDNGINNQFINYVDSYMKPSLTEFVEGTSGNRVGEKRWIVIKEKDTPWVEAIICYNLILYFKAYGINELKNCPVCKRFFTHKGKYAKYCSDACKGSKN